MTMHDSGDRQGFESGAVRDTASGKTRPDLISPHAQIREGEWMRQGAEKYDERNWEKGIPISRCFASLMRHLLAYQLGDQSEDHMAAVRTNASFIIHFEEEIKAGRLPSTLDDMPRYDQKLPTENCFAVAIPGIRAVYDETMREEVVEPEDAGDISATPVVYIAGPMRGRAFYNFPEFLRAGEQWRARGFDVLNPAELEIENGLDPINNPEDAEERVSTWGPDQWREVIIRDIGCILSLRPERGDKIVLLPGWEESTGAFAEVMLARWLNIPAVQDSGRGWATYTPSAQNVYKSVFKWMQKSFDNVRI